MLEKLWGITSLTAPGMDITTRPRSSGQRRDDIRAKMYTGDLYKGMEVSIHSGDAKMHFSVVQATRSKEGRVIVDVLTLTWTINTVATLDLLHVKERK